MNNDPLMALIPAWVNGKLQPMEKLSVHLNGIRHQAVSVFLMRGNEVLIQRRALAKYHTPGLWANTCCTHPHWDEPAETCAHRRIEQELGVTDQALTHKGTVKYRAEVGQDMVEDEVVEVFVGQADADFLVTPNPDEVMDWRWVNLTALVDEISRKPDHFTPWLKIYLAEHRDQILGQ